ncbi:MAG: hypothetical protein CVT98_02750 [Bacteroidetes bacterium HGW-Bacteroidetes-15]|nr:MAG: hypothetical protein CVT98_02750 [Bacteroidetes bacterium HGW-Bacteroidetes-15]
MKKYIYLLIVLMPSMLIFSCGSENKNPDIKSRQADTDKVDSSSIIKTREPIQLKNEEREPKDDEIREFGRIIKIEDGPYPMFFLTIEFPERHMKNDFNLNIESIPMDVASLYKLKGNYAAFYYLSELQNDLLDIQLNGSSLLGDYAPKVDPKWKSITGILKGAEEETRSDLPDEISVTDEKGRTINFKYFITQEMASANGKTVKVFYYTGGVETITYMRPAEN